MPVESKLVDFKTNLDPTPTVKVGCKGGHREGEWSGSSYSGMKSGISANLQTLKTEITSEDGGAKLTTEGPGAGGEIGLSTEHGAAAMLEARVVQATGELGPVYGSVGLNANTGFRLGGGGVQVAALGFGFNLGVGGRFSVDTPVGSVGAATSTNTVEHTLESRNTSRNATNLRYS